MPYAWKQTAQDFEGPQIPWFKLSDGDRARIRLIVPLKEIPVAFRHEFRNEIDHWYQSALCLNNQGGPRNCPACLLGGKDFRARQLNYLVIWNYDAPGGAGVNVWERTPGWIRKKTIPLLGEGYDLMATDLAVTRTGKGLATDYTLVAARSSSDPRLTLPPGDELEALVNALDWEGLLESYPDHAKFDEWFAMARATEPWDEVEEPPVATGSDRRGFGDA